MRSEKNARIEVMQENDPRCLEKVSFHNHTRFSDGADTDVTLLEKALHGGITDFAITDHDSHVSLSPENIDRLVSEAGFKFWHVVDTKQIPITRVEPYQGEYDTGIYLIEKDGRQMNLYRGVEYTVRHPNLQRQMTQRHLVGLGFRYPDKQELDRCAQVKLQRQMRIGGLIHNIRELQADGDPRYVSIIIEESDLSNIMDPLLTTPSRLHLGYVIAEKLNPERPARGEKQLTPRDAMVQYVGEWLPAYNLSAGVTPQLDETVKLIHQLGGIAILPHIHRNGLGNEDAFAEGIYLLVAKYGLDGFEIQVGGYNECVVSERNVKIAEDLNQRTYSGLTVKPGYDGLPADHPLVLVSLGVDFHGIMNGPDKADHIYGTNFPRHYREGQGLRDLKERMNFWRRNSLSS